MVKDVVLLFHPRTFHERNYRYFHVPYSLLSIASTIDRSRYEVHILDNNVLGKDSYLSDIQEFGDRLLCVGISAMIGHQIADGLAFAQAVKTVNPSIPVVWGGALPTVLPDLTIAHELVDIIVYGQGQDSFRELVAALANRNSLNSVHGIAHKVNGHPVFNAPRPFASWEGFPTFKTVYDLIDPVDYIRYDEHINLRTISYHSSQGCPFSCGFCSETALWKNRWSGFAPARILDDVDYLVTSYGVSGLKFYDAEFFIQQDRAMGFAQGVVDRGLPIRWAAAVHPRNLSRLSQKQFSLLHDSGASRLLMGAESGVEEELALVGKKTNREMLLHLAKQCAEFGISASFSFVTGYPGMPSSNIQLTLDFAAELASVATIHEAKVHFFAPYPGTPLYPMALEHGFVPPVSLNEWATYDYYDVSTPWVEPHWEPIVRSFNQEHYIYLSPTPVTEIAGPRAKVCPLL